MAVLRLSHHRYRHRHPTVDVSTVPECSGYTVRGRSVRHCGTLTQPPHQPGNPNPTRIPRFRKFPETNPTRILRFGKFTEPHPTPTRQNHVTPEIEISSSHGDGIYFEAHMQKHVLAHLPKPPFSGGGCGLAQHTYGIPIGIPYTDIHTHTHTHTHM